MNADQFAKRLSEISPTATELKSWGIPEKMIPEWISTYKCKLKDGETRVINNPLLDLISRYDLSTVEIGMLQLGKTKNWKSSGQFQVIGTIESDGLAIRNSDFKIVLLDHDDPCYVLSPIAANADYALDAFIILADALKDISKVDKTGRDDWVRRCVQASGESDSLGLYKTLIGHF